MRFSDQRETIYKGLARMIDEKRPEDMPLPYATPRFLADPPALAFSPVANRASRRKGKRGRQRLPGVALRPEVMPWKEQ